MGRIFFTTENTERTEKIETLFTTEAPSHREKNLNKKTNKKKLKISILAVCSRLRCPSVFLFSLCLSVSVVICLAGCAQKPDPNTLVMIIESSPTNLDPRVGVDAQSERIGELLFDSLVRRDSHFDLQPWLADSWEIPDPLDLRVSLASRRSVPQRTVTDLARREVDL